MCGSPKLIAACHVLHRLSLPRHPPCALSSLTIELTPAQGAESLQSCLKLVPVIRLESNSTAFTCVPVTLLKTLFLLEHLPESLLIHCLCSALYVYALGSCTTLHASRRARSIPIALPNQFRCQTSKPSLSPRRASPEADETCYRSEDRSLLRD